MNLKERLKHISKHYKWIIIGSVLLVSVLVVVCTIHHKHKKQIEISRQEEIMRIEEEIRQMKEEYMQLCSEYNHAVDEYNATAAQFNLFLKKVEPYNVINKTDPLTVRTHIDENFETFREDGADFSAITKDIDMITRNNSIVRSKHEELCWLAYKQIIDDYNTLAEAYNEYVTTTSIDFIEGLPKKISIISSVKNNSESTEDEIIEKITEFSAKIDDLAACYRLVSQITMPDEQWVINRLNTIPTIIGKQAVKESNDPNGLLGKEGGYTSCVYFSVKSIDQGSVKGHNVIEKGTDAGGAIEVYSSLEAAKSRCDYLSQFDNTLLYSGSYVLVGTMVIRTSYKLSNQEQIDLTDEIIKAFTEIE